MKKVFIAVGLAAMSSISFGQNISKDIWLGQMRAALPTAFCSTEQIFRQCYNVSESQCKVAATDATDACLKQFEGRLPAILKQPADGRYWGEQVGMCAGNAYGVMLYKQKINSPKCNN
jgi:hypothetical protein